MINIGYLISTHTNYLVPLNRLLDSMFANGIPPSQIFIASGGNQLHGIPQLQDYRGCSLIEVQHNSFDYTALIELLLGSFERVDIGTFTHFFLLQDTMMVGPSTDNLLYEHAARFPDAASIAAFGGQCNLCLFRVDYLRYCREYIASTRNVTKLQAIHFEGKLHHMAKFKESFAEGTHAVIGKGHPYGGAERIKEYYAGVDVIKWKANYGQNMENMEVRP